MSRWEDGIDRFLLWLDKTARDGLVVTVGRAFGRGANALQRRVFDIDVTPDLLPDEQIRVRTHLHWTAMIVPILGLVLSVAAIVWLWWPGEPLLTLTRFLIPFVVLVFFLDRVQRVRKDLFVITTARAMRFTGVYSRKEAEMPLSRVLDITVEKPFWLRPFGAGHLILENAGQEQGLREVRFLPHPSAIKREIAQLHATPRDRSRSEAAEVPRPSRVADHPPRRSVGARYWLDR